MTRDANRDAWPTHYFGTLTATIRRNNNHPDGNRCPDSAPCGRCQPLLDTIAYNRARTPRWVLAVGDTAGRATELFYAAWERLPGRRR